MNRNRLTPISARRHATLCGSILLPLVLMVAGHPKRIQAGEKNEKQSSHSSQQAADQLRTLLAGFKIGESIRLLPYASLEDWFDPYAALKLEHSLPWSTSDHAFHHLKFESPRDYSWKFRYAANSLSFHTTTVSFLYKMKFDRDTYFYGIGDDTQKSNRQRATYHSYFMGIEFAQEFSDKVVYRWSPGVWFFKSGLASGGEFEQPADARYYTSRFILSDPSVDYWNRSMDNHWSSYVELGLPSKKNTAAYVRFNLETATRLPLSRHTKFGLCSRIEYLISPDREMVPYFVLPEAGSRSGLRGYSKERFRNYGVLVLNLEYAYTLSRQFELFLLADFATTSDEVDFDAFLHPHQDAGLGIRFMNSNKPISAGITTGPEGFKLFSNISTGLPW